MGDVSAQAGGWVWQPAHSLYYNSLTQIWAAPQPDGTWSYSEPVQSTSKSTLDPSEELSIDPRPAPQAYDDVEEGELPYEELLQPQSRPRSPPPPEPVPLLRLVVSRSDVLPSAQKVVVVDAAQPLTIGRDRSFERRVRLKELAVSKTHASLFWSPSHGEGDVGYWAVNDHGSTQGTWLGRGGKETRLSAAKVASAPFPLAHEDTLRLGSTTFSIHLHPSLACAACALAPDSFNLIPLSEPAATEAPAVGLKTHTPTREERATAVRTKMRDLKQQILKPNTPPASAPASRESSPKLKFVDRAAARRARNGPEPTPPAAAARTSAAAQAAAPSPFFTVPGASAFSTAAAASTSAAAADPFAASSRGAQLLAKMSGSPATARTPPAHSASQTASEAIEAGSISTASASPGLSKLVEARTFGQVGREERPGLGSRPMSVVGAAPAGGSAGDGLGAGSEKRGWREDVREMNRKRFREMEAS